MSKETAEKWAEEMLSKEQNEKITPQLLEFMMLGSLLYDSDGNWLPRLERNQEFEIKPVKIKNGKIKL